MNYIFCPSYASVFFALHLKNSGKEIKIITNNVSVRKYCGTADIECIYFDYVSVPITRPYKVLILKSRIDKLIKKIGIKREDNFYLLNNSFAINGFYLAKEWSKRGNVYFNNLEKFSENFLKNNYLNLNFLTSTSLKYLFKLFLGIDLVIFEANYRPIFGINDKFLERNKIKKIALNIDLKELKLSVMKKNCVKQRECDNLIITDGLIGMDIVNHTSFKKMYNNLFGLPYKFMIKAHPNPNFTDKGFFKNCEKYPNHIPSELLLENVKKNVLSVFSSSLIAASQLEHLKAISLLELVEWNNPSYKKEVKNRLTKESNNKIIFVKSFEELNKLLEG